MDCKKLRNWFFILGVIMLRVIAFLSPLSAGGIAVHFAGVALENLKPGGVYNLRELRGLNYIVENRYDSARDFEVITKRPTLRQLEEGYEQVPDPSWVKVIPDRFTLGPRENEYCAIIISIPNDEKYVGHHYQVQLIATAVPPPLGRGLAIAAHVEYKLRLNVGTREPKTLAAAKQREKYLTLNFHLEPGSFYLKKKVEVGKKLYLGRAGWIERLLGRKVIRSVRVVNLGPEAVKLKFESIPVEKRFKIAEEYKPAPEPGFLKCGVKALKVKSNQIREIPLLLHIPDKAKYRGKKYAFILKAELVDTDVPLEIYSRIYVQIE